ncbi:MULTISPECIES: GlxA family transcriptional regulator [unclassified Achromobacter]|uniref:GlxA family transcriptional regulator n=1 Tax=unclassified Achromobacter TaxID=2626865 RepID=UPI000B519B99|nr:MULTISPECIES: GlxA family transcriptional regulator [unclassified Achromobacter]OWT69065.1 AraC family transcriptional regulator [Achromobacter sp. HZ34]OWT70470.1 AraC family transcriptional regulator [Achromobacter sp. HZ28]
MHKIGYLLKDGFQLMSLATQSVFEFANLVAEDGFYEMAYYSLPGGNVRASTGVPVGTTKVTPSTYADTWILGGVLNPIEQPSLPKERAFAREAVQASRRVAAICTGAYTLAEAGLLAGRRATTHWLFADALQERHPDIQVESDRIYIIDGPLWTSAGMTAGLDLALAMVEKDLGPDIARGVAHKLVMHQHRSGGQSQHSEMLDLAPKTDRIQNALNYARKNLAKPLTVEVLAQQANLSPRQFSRIFTTETGQSPAKAIEGLRLEAARLMVERSLHPMEVIARETGFRDRRHMREVFIRGFGVPPQSLRRDAPPTLSA